MTWEYRYESGGVFFSEDRLNALGAKGWELVAVTTGGQVIRGWFKRPLQFTEGEEWDGDDDKW